MEGKYKICTKYVKACENFAAHVLHFGWRTHPGGVYFTCSTFNYHMISSISST